MYFSSPKYSAHPLQNVNKILSVCSCVVSCSSVLFMISCQHCLMYTHCILLSISYPIYLLRIIPHAIVEALWQPASRKGGSGDSYKPVYLFSTSLANKAAAAVEKSRYSTIIQFHQAQPKDPGFLRLPEAEKPPSSKPQRGSVSERKKTEPDTGGEEEMVAKETRSAPRGQKRRNSGRTSDGTVTTRRSRTSEVDSVEKVPSPQPFLRSSRRLRQQRNRSIASPPLQSPSSTDGPRSPLPPSPPSGVRPRPRKSSQTTPSNGAGGSTQQQQRSLRRKRNNLHEDSPTSPLPDLFEPRVAHQVEEMDSPSDEEEKRNDEMSDGEPRAEKRARLDGSETDKQVISSPSMQSPEQQRSIPQPGSREEENYTICHGTPVNKTPSGGDISSPKSWSQQQQQQQQRQQQQLQQQQQGQYQLHPQPHPHSQQHQQVQHYGAAGAQAGQTQQPRLPGTPSSEAVTFSPPMGQVHPGSSSSPVGGQYDHRSATAAGAHALAAGVTASGGLNGSSGGRNVQADYAHRHHLMTAAEHAHHRDGGSTWSAAAAAGLHPQFAGIPGAYPGAYPPMYSHAGIPGMHYSGQPMPGANYPYPMPYHWGHHPHPSAAAAAAVPQFGSHGDHMIQQQQQHHQQQQHRQAAAGSKEVAGHHDVLQHPHISGGPTPESPQSASLMMRGQHATGSSSAQSINVTSSSTAAGKASSRAHYPSQTLHQLAAQGTAAPHTLSHQVPHGVVSADHHLPPGAHQAAAFPYGFDSSAHSLSHMHMLQQSQMQAPQIRSLPGVPPHHLSPHMASRGLWYSHQPMAAHQMLQGGSAEIPGYPAHSKKTSKGSKSAPAVDLDKNRNTNNNNAESLIINGMPLTNQETDQTQEFVGAAVYTSTSSTTGAAFSVENLAAPYTTAHLVGVSTTPPPPLPPSSRALPRQRLSSREGALPAVSMILERTRQD